MHKREENSGLWKKQPSLCDKYGKLCSQLFFVLNPVKLINYDSFRFV
jgi:hypothetical protein